jgi:hypothetical protein
MAKAIECNRKIESVRNDSIHRDREEIHREPASYDSRSLAHIEGRGDGFVAGFVKGTMINFTGMLRNILGGMLFYVAHSCLKEEMDLAKELRETLELE